MALGADDRAVPRLFLAESFVIPVHAGGTLLAIMFAVVVGILLGWYPASRAPRLDPVEAIREL